MAEYIEREAAVLQLLEKGQASRRYKLGDVWELNFDEIREAIASIPAADVRPVVMGQWENTGSDVWKCSACGYGIMPWNAGVNFCPNCGADMREE